MSLLPNSYLSRIHAVFRVHMIFNLLFNNLHICIVRRLAHIIRTKFHVSFWDITFDCFKDFSNNDKILQSYQCFRFCQPSVG